MRGRGYAAGSRFFGRAVSVPAIGTKAKVLVPRGAERLMLYSISDAFTAQLEPLILGVAYYSSEIPSPYGTPTASAWRLRGSRSSLVDDLTDGVTQTTSGQIFATAEKTDHLYVGFQSIVDTLNIEVSVTNDVTATLSGEYWNGAEWIALPGFMDNTQAVGAQTLSGDGNVTWNDVPDWKVSKIDPERADPYVAQSPDAYWIRLSWSDVLNPKTKLKSLYPEYTQVFDSAAPFRKGQDYEINLTPHTVGGLTLESAMAATTVNVAFWVNQGTQAGYPMGGYCPGCGSGAMPNAIVGPRMPLRSSVPAGAVAPPYLHSRYPYGG